MRAVFGAPFVERGAAHAVFAAELAHGNAGLGLLEDAQYLRVGVARFFMSNLLGRVYEKILLFRTTFFGGIT